MLGRASEPARERESKLLRPGAMSDIGDRAEMSYKHKRKRKRNLKSEKPFFFLSGNNNYAKVHLIERGLANDRRYDSNDSLGMTNCSSDTGILVLEEIDKLSDFFQKLFFSGGEG